MKNSLRPRLHGAGEAYYEWDWLDAENEFQKAIKIKPESARAHHEYALFLIWRGRTDEAIPEMNRALALESTSLTLESFGGAAFVNTDAGMMLYWARKYDRAIEQLHKASEMDSFFWERICILE